MSGGVILSLSPLGESNLGLLSNPEFLERADCFRRQLLAYDLDCGGAIDPLDNELLGGIMPCARDVFRCWGAPFPEDEAFRCELFEAIQFTADFSPNGLSPQPHASIAALDFLCHMPNARHSPMREIADTTNELLAQMGEEPCVTERKLGAILTKLGFPRRARGGEGGSFRVEYSYSVKDLIHRLMSHYGGLEVELYGSYSPDVMCPLCRKHRRLSEPEMKHYEEVIKPREELKKREEMEQHERRMERLRKNPPLVISRKSIDGETGESSP
jgi:hypothetical protein